MRKETKTAAGVRSITMSPEPAKILAAHIERYTAPALDALGVPQQRRQPAHVVELGHVRLGQAHRGSYEARTWRFTEAPGDPRKGWIRLLRHSVWDANNGIGRFMSDHPPAPAYPWLHQEGVNSIAPGRTVCMPTALKRSPLLRS